MFLPWSGTLNLILSTEKPIVNLTAVDCVKILLVDDSKTLLHENERVLHKSGYEVICAEDGVSALQMAQAQQPDLILLDMILPPMSGPDGSGATARSDSAGHDLAPNERTRSPRTSEAGSRHSPHPG